MTIAVDDIVLDVAALAQSIGLEVHGLGPGPSFGSVPIVYGPLDSIAILVDTFFQRKEQVPRRYRARRIHKPVIKAHAVRLSAAPFIVTPAGTEPAGDDVIEITIETQDISQAAAPSITNKRTSMTHTTLQQTGSTAC